MPRRFDRLGISFQYPDNWTLDEEDALSDSRSVTVYSPGGGFWSVAVHPATADPRTLAQAAIDAMKEEYGAVEVDEVRDELGGRDLVAFDLAFFYLDLTNTAQVRCLKTERLTLTIFCQAEDHDFDGLELVFKAITTSLLRGV